MRRHRARPAAGHRAAPGLRLEGRTPWQHAFATRDVAIGAGQFVALTLWGRSRRAFLTLRLIAPAPARSPEPGRLSVIEVPLEHARRLAAELALIAAVEAETAAP